MTGRRSDTRLTRIKLQSDLKKSPHGSMIHSKERRVQTQLFEILVPIIWETEGGSTSKGMVEEKCETSHRGEGDWAKTRRERMPSTEPFEP